MKRYLSLLAIAWLTCLATPAVAGDAHGAPANRVDGDVGTYEHASEAAGGAALWETLDGLLGNAAARQAQPAAMWMGSGYTSGYAVSGRTCKLLERESRLFKSGLDTGIYTPADLSKSSIAEHAKKAGIPRYSPAFWTIATSSLVAANPANVDLPAQKMGEKMYDLCMHKFLGNEITYQ
jgi:hypothetical protein